MKYRTTFTAKAQLIQPDDKQFKAIASSIQDKYGFELKPQMDLLYVSACLVSAGDSVGVNDNDDIFTREEAWAARHTPVLKPFNWQHQDKDIVGVMYTVQARNLDGEVLDISDDTPPDEDFDLYVEAAIFKLVHEDRSAEIEARSKAGNLFVSMEAWFDDYGYGFFDKDKSLAKVITRNSNTSFLDKHLRANSGAGVYRDPEEDKDMRIGRVLRSITFGGCGFVDQPANKRSDIEAVESMVSFAEHNTELEVLDFLNTVLDSNEELSMNTQANSQQPTNRGITADELNATLDKREREAAEARAQAALETRASDLEGNNQELQSQIQELTEAKDAKVQENEALKNQMNEYAETVDTLVKEHVSAGATGDTPAEIAAIDAATDGDAAFTAKLAWLQKSMASLRDRASRADELETQLAEAESIVREQEVRHLFSDHFSAEAVDAMVARASNLNDEAYAEWRDEKELMILEMSAAAKDKEKMMKEKMKNKDKEDKKDGAYAGNPFTSILEQRRSEGMADPDTMRNNPNEPDLINHPGDGSTDVNSGVSADSIRTPRHKIAGSAGDDPAEVLDNVEEQGGVSLAGSQVGDDGEAVNPFRSLASIVVDTAKNEKENNSENKPGFDPVS